MQDTPMRVVTRERQDLAEMERAFDEAERRQEERFDLIRRKRARLQEMGVDLGE
ncbi:hypothetical protein roselon_00601 [Roseibacterium elongatum DSM 19469]|uniref:Uncharacterized protein n=1 Tax=Roseicyclus elongatus DSM 19469 TaxID=1294273 RepID=W8S2S7_9RHOB|nr:hypothetical protein [Roseibacterium elongatum]AHM03041.1 hypothetical protein roselon_00601 [Roseibacterium elongatum DSM 19469]